MEEEFFIEGLANTYDTQGATDAGILSSDHAYRARIVVRRPTSGKRFNGVVVLEWQNVTAGYELDAHWAPSWRHFVRYGYAWVGFSAQLVGVQGFQDGLVQWNSERYGALDVTDGGAVMNDALCYDIYSQAAQAIKNPDGVNPMGGLDVEMVLASGAS